MSDEETEELWQAYKSNYLAGQLEENMLMYRLVFVAGLRYGKSEKENRMPKQETVVSVECEIVPLDRVLLYYAKDFTAKEGEIFHREFFVDPAKGVVIFRLFFRKPKPECADSDSPTV